MMERIGPTTSSRAIRHPLMDDVPVTDIMPARVLRRRPPAPEHHDRRDAEEAFEPVVEDARRCRCRIDGSPSGNGRPHSRSRWRDSQWSDTTRHQALRFAFSTVSLTARS